MKNNSNDKIAGNNKQMHIKESKLKTENIDNKNTNQKNIKKGASNDAPYAIIVE